MKFIAITLILSSLTFITGCELKKNTTDTLKPIIVKQENPSMNNDDLVSCEKELDALKDLDSEKYKSLSGKFIQMMKGAAGYSRVRSSVNQSTQGAIDALYHYSSIKLCTEIMADTLEALASKPGV